MKISMTALIALLFLAPALCAELPVWVEGAAVVDLDNPVNLAIEGNVLIDVVKKLQVRANVISFNLTNGFRFFLGSGMGLDLLLHSRDKGKVSLYVVGGFSLNTGGGSTYFTGRIGPGFILGQTRRTKLFLEPLLNFSSYFGNSHLGVSISAGIRCR